MKSGFWQIQIMEFDHYKTAFRASFGHCEWNITLFGLENASFEFQNIIHDIFNPFPSFIIVYSDDLLVFSKTIDQYFKYLKTFLNITERNGLAVSASKVV